MALLFRRVARNLAKHGFYPTDPGTIAGVSRLLVLSDPDRATRLLDPCCGAGAAAAALAQTLGSSVLTYGIEFDESRALAAHQVLDECLWSDVQDTYLDAGSWQLLYLNPPYGLLSSDKAATGNDRTTRFEELFLERALPALCMGGVLVFVIPRYELRGRTAELLASNFERLQVYRAAVDTYQQIVVMGVRTRRRPAASAAAALENLEVIPPLPEAGQVEPYLVPPALKPSARFDTHSLDPHLLLRLAGSAGQGGLWSTFDLMFTGEGQAEIPPPLERVGTWHLALLVAAGAIDGVVRVPGGPTMLLKGSTRKETREVRREIEEGRGDQPDVEKITSVERFQAEIRGFDLTPGEPTFGRLFIVR